MKNLLIILLLAVTILNLSAQTETRTPGSFTAIENHCSVDVIIRQGTDEKVVVYAPQKYINQITTKVSINTLYIDVDGPMFINNEVVKIEVTTKELKEITNSGSADIEFIGGFTTNNMLIEMQGSGDLEGTFNVKDMEIKMHGSGDVEISGVNNSLDVEQIGSGDFEGESLHLGTAYFRMSGSGEAEVEGTSAMMELTQSGSGDFDGRAFQVKTAKVRKSSSGEASVHVTENIDVRISGSGDLIIKGRPGITNFSATGSGEIITL
jgi:hypothetical protein